MKKLLMTATVLAVTAGAAQAAGLEKGWYLGASGGWNHTDDQVFKSPAAKDKVKYDEGWVAGVNAGYAWGNNWRTEIEGNYRENDVNKVKGVGASGGDGSFRSWDAMLNQIYDFNNRSRWTPYLGVGVGAVWQDARHIGNVFAPATTIDKSSVAAFAYQGIAGVEYDITPQAAFGLRYNYFGALQGERFKTNTGARVKDSDGYGNHAVQVTFRYGFDKAAEPMPAPRAETAAPVVAAPTPTTYAVPTEAMIEASPYKIFFANDSAQLNDAGHQVVASAADAVKSQNVGIIQLTSNTDTTGSVKHNDNLSERRAKAVRQALIAQGVSPSMIKIISNAERELPVPTGDHVREPRNRVVTIVLQ